MCLFNDCLAMSTLIILGKSSQDFYVTKMFMTLQQNNVNKRFQALQLDHAEKRGAEVISFIIKLTILSMNLVFCKLHKATKMLKD